MWKAELTILYEGSRQKLEVSKETLSIGRSSDSDIVLQDPAVSSHHCEIRFIRGQYFIIDRESSNGTWVNGREVGRSELLPGNRISVGDTTLVFTRKARPKLNLSSKRLTSFLPSLNIKTVAVLIVMLGLVFIFSRHFRTPGRVLLDSGSFEIGMVEESGGLKNLVRSEISISAGLLHFYFDDLEKKRHLYREARLSVEEVNELRGEIMNSGFFEIDVVNESSSEGGGLVTISAKLDSLERKVSFSKDLPEGIASLKDKLELVMAEKFNFPSLTLSGDELVEKGEIAFARGKLLHGERERRSDNLSNSIRAFKEALWYLEAVEPKPVFLSTVEEYLYRSQEELTDEFNKLRFQVEKAMRVSEWDVARASLEEILARIPDKTDERYRYAMRRFERVREK